MRTSEIGICRSSCSWRDGKTASPTSSEAHRNQCLGKVCGDGVRGITDKRAQHRAEFVCEFHGERSFLLVPATWHDTAARPCNAVRRSRQSERPKCAPALALYLQGTSLDVLTR